MEQRLENNELYKVVKSFNEKEVSANVFDQHLALLPKLRPYQEQAVQWMLNRELRPIIQNTHLKLDNSGSEASGSEDVDPELYVERIPTGGILSDEMGLGKTVEVLACILHNPRTGIIIPQGNLRHPVDDDGINDDDDDGEEVYLKRPSRRRASAMKGGRGSRAENSGEEMNTDESSSNLVEAIPVEGCNKEVVIEEEVTSKSGATEKSSEFSTTQGMDAMEQNCEEEQKIPQSSEKKKKERKSGTKASKRKSGDDNDWEPEKKIKKNKNKASAVRSMKRGNSKSKNEAGKKPLQKIPMIKQVQSWYESKLAEVNKNPIRAYYETMADSGSSSADVQCICTEGEEKPLIKCNDCSRLMHKECIGALQWIGSEPIYCPQCWLKKPPIQSRATLIVSPTSISAQWLQEIEHHISKEANFKVMIYNGVKSDGFSQPYAFADYDVILTTYDTLRRELVLAEVHEGRRLRYEKRYFSPTCPLLCVDFWRICLDEAQMVEGTTSKTAEMVSRLSAVHRWAVTGTPIQKGLHDLYGLVMFLCVEPYSDHATWLKKIYQPYCDGDRQPLYTLLAHIMWRSSKADVLDQIQIPPQTEQMWCLNFSPVEEHFYLRTHQECSNDFLERLAKFQTLDVPLQSLRLKEVNHLLAPLLKLRQACSHPQAVRGNVISNLKKTMTMTELLESLIKKTIVEAQDALRKHIASLNGLAALHIICNEFVTAAEKYREVIHITREYNDRFKVDTLQRIHTLNNLAEIIAAHKDIIPPTMRDDQLRDDAKQLEENYMSKAQLAVTTVEEPLVELSEAVTNLEKEISEEGDADWWIGLCKSLDRDEILSRVHDALVNHRKSAPDISSTSIINRVSTIQGIQLTVLQWLESLEKTQGEVRKSLKALRCADNEVLVNAAVDCHLRISNLKSKTSKALCSLCLCESSLKKYEMILFDIKIKKNENIMVGDVYLLGQGKEGSWKPSEQETVLKTLLSMGKHRKADNDVLKCGSKFLRLMNALRREFKPLRLLWSRINERTQAQDELNMCNLRLRLRLPGEATSSQQSPSVNRRKKQEANRLSSNIDTKMETLHVIEAHQVEAMAHQNRLEAIAALSELRKKSGTVTYLENLRKKGDDPKSSPELCPVCQGTLENKWAVLSCGHCYCMECFPQLFRKKHVQCAMCRETTEVSDISFVNLGCEDECTNDSAAPNLVIPSVQGSYSTKVEGIVKRIFYLRGLDPLVKLLIFSTWDRVLDVLQEALDENGVRNLRLKSGPKYELTLKEFKKTDDENPINVLLLHLKLGSKGLNLTEATHVILIEPLLNPADELQAIGRVHRIGQTKPTFVHRFLIRETIEERMFSAVQATGKELWSGQQVTLQRLKDLFSTQSAIIPTLPDTSSSNVNNSEVVIDS